MILDYYRIFYLCLPSIRVFPNAAVRYGKQFKPNITRCMNILDE